MKSDPEASILCFGRKIDVLPIFSSCPAAAFSTGASLLQGKVTCVLSCWCSAAMGGRGLQDEALWAEFLHSPGWQSCHPSQQLCFCLLNLLMLQPEIGGERRAPPRAPATEPQEVLRCCWKHFAGGSWQEGRRAFTGYHSATEQSKQACRWVSVG